MAIRPASSRTRSKWILSNSVSIHSLSTQMDFPASIEIDFRKRKSMKKLAFIFFLIVTISAQVAFAQGSNITKKELNQAEIDRIVKKFTANEGAFREALTNYVFNRSATINTIGMGGQVT